MATFTKSALSGSTSGKGIVVAATETAGTLIHTAVAGSTAGVYDEIWLYAQNIDTSNVALTIEFGGVAVPGDTIKVTVAYQAGLVPIVPGFPLQGGCEVRAFAGTANVIEIFGFVNKIA